VDVGIPQRHKISQESLQGFAHGIALPWKWCILISSFCAFVTLSNYEVCDNGNAVKQCNFQNTYGEKTNVMVFPISKGNAFNISLNGFPIAKLHSCRYLGLHIDDELTWKSHIDVVYTKLVKFIGIFYKLRNKLPQTVLHLFTLTSHMVLNFMLIHLLPTLTNCWFSIISYYEYSNISHIITHPMNFTLHIKLYLCSD